MSAKTPDLSEFFKLSRPKQKPCAVALVRQQIDTASLSQLDAAFAQDVGIITNAAIRDWLKARELFVNDAAISAHRRGVCACARAA